MGPGWEVSAAVPAIFILRIPDWGRTLNPGALMRLPHPAALAALLAATAPMVAAGQEPAVQRPPEVTDSAIVRGREIFHGSGNCAACHGAEGIGTESGPGLRQGIWMHGPDTFQGILDRVVHGIPKAWSTRDVAMPIRGWATLDDEAARAVAAYVWEISHAWTGRPRGPSGS